MSERRSQLRLLRETDWNALIVLDACRADAYRDLAPAAGLPLGEIVRSPAWCTRVWLPRLAEIVGERELLYVTANPVPNRELERKGQTSNFHWVRLWQNCWGRYGPCDMPTVHPDSVADAVLHYVRDHGQPALMVVHFIQPHMPYIGAHALPYADWGHATEAEFEAELRQHKHPAEAVCDGEATRDDIRAAYMGNLAVALPAVVQLLASLRGTLVVTADHGELLGERGAYGHTAGPGQPELTNVPWVVVGRDAYDPAPIPATLDAGRQKADAMLVDRLQSLGYT